MLKLSGWSRLNSGRTLKSKWVSSSVKSKASMACDTRSPTSLTAFPLSRVQTSHHVYSTADSLRGITKRDCQLCQSIPKGERQEGSTDAEADVPLAEALGAICVQRLDDSRNSAIHIKYRISLRSSSMWEPRYPLLRVVSFFGVSITEIQSFS